MEIILWDFIMLMNPVTLPSVYRPCQSMTELMHNARFRDHEKLEQMLIIPVPRNNKAMYICVLDETGLDLQGAVHFTDLDERTQWELSLAAVEQHAPNWRGIPAKFQNNSAFVTLALNLNPDIVLCVK